MNKRRKYRLDEQIADAIGDNKLKPADIWESLYNHVTKQDEEEKSWQELRDEEVKKRIEQTKNVKPKTKGQERYWNSIETSVITICSGPAGTGKTYLPCYIACKLLQSGKIKKIIITRPNVSCGAGYGFRPGNVLEKFTPVVRPMLDALNEFLGAPTVQQYIQENIIELWPLDDMRGASIKDSFIICDEAQNAEFEQIHMLLTRVDKGTTLVVCGDATQTDLVNRHTNPLLEVMGLLRKHGVVEISQIFLTDEDIVRNGIIRKINKALSQRNNYYNDIDCVIKNNDTWYKVSCNNCEAQLWVNNGDENNEQIADVSAISCCHCGKEQGLLIEDGKATTCFERRKDDKVCETHIGLP